MNYLKDGSSATGKPPAIAVTSFESSQLTSTSLQNPTRRLEPELAYRAADALQSVTHELSLWDMFLVQQDSANAGRNPDLLAVSIFVAKMICPVCCAKCSTTWNTA